MYCSFLRSLLLGDAAKAEAQIAVEVADALVKALA